jgi:hypothetical protein
MRSVLRVILWGKEVGRLAWDVKRRLAYFVFNPDNFGMALDIAPLVASIKSPKAIVQSMERKKGNTKSCLLSLQTPCRMTGGTSCLSIGVLRIMSPMPILHLLTNCRSSVNGVWAPWSLSQMWSGPN